MDNDSVAGVSYEFDALGRRVARDDGTNVTVCVQSGQQTIADYASGAAATSPTYTYYYASYVDEPIYRTGTGGSRYYHRTQQYSITALTDSNANVTERYAYTAYGTPTILSGAGNVLTSSADANCYMYTGREWDSELSLYHYRARMYDSISGRLLGRDRIEYADDGNVYQYVRLRPQLLLDPFGLQSCPSEGTTFTTFFDPLDISGMPWERANLGIIQTPEGRRARMGLSTFNVEAKCKRTISSVSQIPSIDEVTR